MRELTLTGDVCNVLKKIHELAELTPTGADILYPIENWDPRSIRAADEKKDLETLDAMYHVIKLKGYEQKDRVLVFSLTQTKLFEKFYDLNCEIDSHRKKHEVNTITNATIHISDRKGLYREDDPQVCYPVRGNRKLFIQNLHRGNPINHTIRHVLDGNISAAVKEINRISRRDLKINFNLIDHSKSSSYFINESCTLIEDDISPVVISD